MSDVVVHIAGSDLSAFLSHLPNPDKPWWQTFITIGTPIVTAATSIITVCVLVANKNLTRQVATSNQELADRNHNLTKEISESNRLIAEQQAETARENKEIAKMKFKFDLFEKRLSFLSEFKEISGELTAGPLSYEKLKEIRFDDTINLKAAFVEYCGYINRTVSSYYRFQYKFKSVLLLDTRKELDNYKDSLEIHRSNLSSFYKSLTEIHDLNIIQIMDIYNNICYKSNMDLYEKSAKIYSSMYRNEFSGISEIILNNKKI